MSAPATAARQTEPLDTRFLNRELSWLAFNARVLEQASDRELPVLERVRFCSIVSSNMDEFFMVRVAGIERQVAAGLVTRSPDGRVPGAVLAEIRQLVTDITTRQATLWADDLVPALAAEGIPVIPVSECTEAELEQLEALFDSTIFPVLTPLAVGPGQPFPYISGLSQSLAVRVRDSENGEERSARVKVPEGLARFVAVGLGASPDPSGTGDRPLLAVALPRDGGARARVLPGDPRRGLRAE